ncbi:hypothetical protein ABXJ76_03760 [Methylobacter sp. G7]|uniref:hypothetical protein n=1 Tax=Methylobacter sp. G7 TaxID=3230117 RepID=UPI003D8071DD
MWLQTTFGSFSINQTEVDRSVGMLTISSYSRHDIDAFVSRFMPHGFVQYADESAEFQFFVRAPQANVAVSIAAAVSDIYYSDFIGAVQQTQGDSPRTKCYYGVASQLSSIQHENNEYGLGNQDPKGIEPEKILEIGCEGGSFTLWRYPNRGERGFIVNTFDCCSDFLSKEDQIDDSKALQRNAGLRQDTNNYLQEWDEAILKLPESWALMYPVYISEAYWPFIFKELRLRGVEPTQGGGWIYALKESQDKYAKK